MLKKSLLAVAMAASMPAFAAIDGPASGNGELFLAVSNPFGAENSRFTYVFDTGISMNNFLPVSSALGVTEASTLSDTAFSLALPGWNSFVSTLTGAGGLVSDLRFTVFALDGTGTNNAANPNSLRMLFTTDSTAGVMASNNTDGLQNGDLTSINSGSSKVTQFVAATNGLATHNSPGNGSSVFQRTSSVDQADYSNAFLDKIGFTGSQINFIAGTALGQLARFAYAGNSPTAGTGYSSKAATVINYSFGNADVDNLASGLAATFSILDDGSGGANLVYTAPIPEPGEWAFMMAGLGLVGMIARRRRAAVRA